MTENEMGGGSIEFEIIKGKLICLGCRNTNSQHEHVALLEFLCFCSLHWPFTIALKVLCKNTEIVVLQEYKIFFFFSFFAICVLECFWGIAECSIQHLFWWKLCLFCFAIYDVIFDDKDFVLIYLYLNHD